MEGGLRTGSAGKGPSRFTRDGTIADMYASEHRCKDGRWRPGPVRDCPACKPARVQTFLPAGDLPGKAAGRKTAE